MLITEATHPMSSNPPDTETVEKIALLGSTGSIGTQVLDVVNAFPQRFKVIALAAGNNLDRLTEQIKRYQPTLVSVQHPESIDILKDRLTPSEFNSIQWVSGEAGLKEVAAYAPATMMINGLVGMVGLAPTLSAVQACKKVLTANKETFVAGGHLVQPYLNQIIPLDSEHSAIFQCLANHQQTTERIRTLYLTASGGPFRTWSAVEMATISKAQALKHPNWVMGQKITVDSATLMNKGLEVIEAHWLFGLPYEKIKVVVHPESILHGAIEWCDGSIIGQMGAPDMHVPIQVAMLWPDRGESTYPNHRLDLTQLSNLSFSPPDLERFPCLQLAYTAGSIGPAATAILNAANETFVQAFLQEQIHYLDIAKGLEAVLSDHSKVWPTATNIPTLPDIIAIDAWGRLRASEWVTGHVQSKVDSKVALACNV